MSDNRNLIDARNAKDDEFYTLEKDIESEVFNYDLKNKIIYCNCDNPEWSNFWAFFHKNFTKLKLKALVSTFYSENSYMKYYDGGNDEEIDAGIVTSLEGNGDFRSNECLHILDSPDVVIVTNPPFSLFREFISVLEKYNKKFLIIGSMNAITYREVFPLIKNDKLWLGKSHPKEFIRPDGTTKKFGNILWYTNLDYPKRHEDIKLTKEYNEEDYPKYDDYDCIEVSKAVNIPKDYNGVMGVPISFLTKYNPDQFEILGLDDHRVEWKGSAPSINGKQVYRRIIIRCRKI